MPPTLNSTGHNTGRNVTIFTIVLGIVGACAPMLANMDLTSTAGVVAALVAISPVVIKYLDGSQAYEARMDAPPAGDGAIAAPPLTSNGRPTDDMIDSWSLPTSVGPGEPDGEEIADVPDPPGDDELEEHFAAAPAGAPEPEA